MKSEEYLESKKHYKLGTNGTEFIVSIEHAKTYGKIVSLEKDIEYWQMELRSADFKTRIIKKIEELESEIEKLMKL